MDRIDSLNAIDLGGGKRGFQDQILSSGSGSQEGTWVSALWLNGVQEEIMTVIEAAGFVGDKTKNNLLAKALISGKLTYIEDSSNTPNVLTLAPVLIPTALTAGMGFRVKVANSNTGATTATIGALGTKEVVRNDGSILFDSDLVAGGLFDLIYDGTRFKVLSTIAAPRQLRAMTLYVNQATGNDANDGTANTAGKAMASIQSAVNRAWSYGPGAYTVTIFVAPGTYNYVVAPARPGPKLDIQGTGAVAADVNITAGAGFDSFATLGTSNVSISKVKGGSLTGTGGFVGYDQSVLIINNCETGQTSGAQVQAFGGASVTCLNHRFTGSALSMYRANVGGKLTLGGVHTIPAAITASYVALASNLGSIAISASNPLSFSGGGNVTGQRYSAATNAVIDTAGGGANFFPGTSAGSTGAGGQYV